MDNNDGQKNRVGKKDDNLATSNTYNTRSKTGVKANRDAQEEEYASLCLDAGARGE